MHSVIDLISEAYPYGEQYMPEDNDPSEFEASEMGIDEQETNGDPMVVSKFDPGDVDIENTIR